MEGLTVARMGGAGAVAVQEALRGVYAEAFAGAPYCVTEDEATASFRRFPSQAGRAGFRAVLGRDAGGEPVGMAYGCLLEAGSAWWGGMSGDVCREDGRRSFLLMELAVRARWRGRGVARRLHEVLLDGVGAERVVLNVHPESGAAQAAYRAWGYRKVGETRPWEGADPHDVMVLGLD
ncbi:GNAT family N-acetyltransferase [Streptomyces coeruleorubidus]|uniref:GNAT family N-acetyltransferase n=1 Tax=Streptomyces coeruleorubidus TaxID=116188 RepID=UPI003701AEA7